MIGTNRRAERGHPLVLGSTLFTVAVTALAMKATAGIRGQTMPGIRARAGRALLNAAWRAPVARLLAATCRAGDRDATDPDPTPEKRSGASEPIGRPGTPRLLVADLVGAQT